ncbi:hypothetical protein MNB_SV-14-18 [hydrothermal vent metagenome]|uniref:Alpha/beta hydrolase n=1 Tax=hydrothermal vent metagenome TaxID=652676 RepID=A0A1W1BSL7_9ZZZZ
MQENKKVYLLPGRKGKLDGFIGTLLLNMGYDVYGREIDGAFENLRISKQIDIIQNDLKNNLWNKNSIVIGSSYGAYLFMHSILDIKNFPARVLLFSPVLGKSRVLANRPISYPPRGKKLLEYKNSNKLPQIDIEVHTGSDDPICDPQLAEDIISAIKNSKLKIVEGASHQLERDYIKAVLNNFLS